jgi:hypothetical protein
MSENWTWRCVDADGRDLESGAVEVPAFASQSDAETWLGEHWPSLVDAGIDGVHLRDGGTVVYGPMSLRPAE